MMVFPYNAMFAYDRKPGDSIISYRIMVNERTYTTPDFLIGKKDFLETSPRVFAHYLESENTVYVDQYVKDRWEWCDGNMDKVSLCHLVPLICLHKWPGMPEGRNKSKARRCFVAPGSLP